MDDTIEELYSKYTSSVEEALGDDKYFQYMFEMIQASDNTLHQTNRVLHKVVDESWLNVVEDGIEAIFNIVDKPRRFITTSEEVVPVALAKKITADSVRHLSQNTQFIATNAAGEMQPTKILNVTTEESYDLYENRFVYHLIQRLFAFVDKRTDVIFWSTGDETCNIMSMESKVDDAYEEISYKVEMTIKNKESLVENDADNMSVFKRIDRVRRMSRVLRSSSFCEIMNGCAKVYSPIQRTNLMMKDPDYRRCYKLWQFIESYDEVGYSIEEQDSAMEFDEEYLLQMYINMITNYTVFKSLLESDPRKMWEIAQEKKDPVKPKFVKEIKEEIVENRDIPDVEIRKVFVEEVTQAQLEAEAALEEEKQHSQELEQTLSEMQFSMSDLEWQIDSLNQQMIDMSDQISQAEAEKNDLTIQLDEEKKQHEQTRAAAAAELESVKTAAAAELEDTQKRASEEIAKAQAAAAAAELEKNEEIERTHKVAAEEVSKAREEAAAGIEAANKDKEEQLAVMKADTETRIASAWAEAEAQIARTREETAAQIAEIGKRTEEELSEAKSSAAAELAETKNAAAAEVAEIQAETKAQIEEARKAAAEEIAKAQEAAAEMVSEARRAAAEEVAKVQTEAAEQIETARRTAAEEVAKAKTEASELVGRTKAQAETEIEQTKTAAAAEIEQTKAAAAAEIEQTKAAAAAEIEQTKKTAAAEIDTAQKAAASAAKREQKALEKAQAASLSHYIVSALKERRERKESEQKELEQKESEQEDK